MFSLRNHNISQETLKTWNILALLQKIPRIILSISQVWQLKFTNRRKIVTSVSIKLNQSFSQSGIETNVVFTRFTLVIFFFFFQTDFHSCKFNVITF